MEDDPNLTPGEKRYDRVRKWTKKVNLFEKDFVVVPINEHAHWFVCVICYPGKLRCLEYNEAITVMLTPPPPIIDLCRGR